MTVIALSTNANIQAWELDHENADLVVDGVTLVGTAAAAYLFGQALRTVDLSVFGAAGQERFFREDALLEFPPGSGERVSLAEVSDALRYKYSIDPLVEFSSGVGLKGYSLADVNGILGELDAEFGQNFTLPLLDRAAATETVFITQELPAAPLSELLNAEGRQSLVDMADRMRSTLVGSSALLERLNTVAGIALDEVLFPNPPGPPISGRALMATFSASVGVDMAASLPDLFADDALNFADLNTLLAAAREAVPERAAQLASVVVPEPVFVGASGQRYMGGQAVLGYLGQALSTLNDEARNGKYFNASDAVLNNPFNRANSEYLSISELAGPLKALYGIDLAPLLASQGTYWSIREVNGLLAKINTELGATEFQALTPTALVNSDGTVMSAGQAFSYAASLALGSAATSAQLANTWNQASPGATGLSQSSFSYFQPPNVLNLNYLTSRVNSGDPDLLSGLSAIGGNSQATADTYTGAYLLSPLTGTAISEALFEYPPNSGNRLSLEELSQTLAREYLGAPDRGSAGGDHSLVDWFMGTGQYQNGGGFTSINVLAPSAGPAVANDALYFMYGTSLQADGQNPAGNPLWDGSRYLAPGEEARLNGYPRLSEYSIQQAMFALYWVNAGTTPRALATPTFPSSSPDLERFYIEPFRMAALAQAAKSLTTLTPADTVIGTNFSAAALATAANAAVRPAETVLRDQLAEIRRQLAAHNPFQVTALALGTSEQARAGSLTLGRALIANLQENPSLLARLSFDQGIGLDEPLWREADGQYRSLGEWLDATGLRERMLQAWPALATTGLDYQALNRLLVTARELNPSRAADLDFTHPWMQAYTVAERSFNGSNALLLRVADSLFAQASTQDKNVPIASDERVLADPTDPTGTRRLSLDDVSHMATLLLGADPLPKQSQWYALDIEQAIKTLYAAVQAEPPLGAPGRTSSAAITAAELVAFVNSLQPGANATFGPDAFDARATLFTTQVNGATVSRSFRDLLTAFSTATGKDLAPRLESLGILRDGQQVQLRGLNELRAWVSSQLPGQVSTAALTVTGTPTAVDATVDYGAVIATTQEDAWGLGALQRLMAEWALVPTANHDTQWPRWQARLAELLRVLDATTEGPTGLGLDAATDTALRGLLTTTTPPELFPGGPAIMAWLRSFDQNAAATLAELDRNLRHLDQALASTAYAQSAAQTALTARRSQLAADRAAFVEARTVASRLLAASSTLGTFNAALAAERNLNRGNDVLAWLDRFEVPAAALTDANFRSASAGLDTFDFALWSTGRPAGSLTSTAALAGLASAATDWATSTQPILAWLDAMVATTLPRLRPQLVAAAALADALADADPTNNALAVQRTAAQARVDRLDALSAAAIRLGAVRNDPDAFRTALTREATTLGVGDILAELARHDVPAAELSTPAYQSSPSAVEYFDVTAFWIGGRDGAAGGDGGAPAQLDAAALGANQAWLNSTTPVLAWVDQVRSRVVAMQQATDDAVARLRTAWLEPSTSAADLATLQSRIDELLQARTAQNARLAEIDRLLAVRHDARALQAELTAQAAALPPGGSVLKTWAAFNVDPASLQPAGAYVQTVAGVWLPKLSDAQAAAAAASPYPDDDPLIKPYDEWATNTPAGRDWRVWLDALVTRTATLQSELAIDQATLAVQRAGLGLSEATLQQIDQAQWRIAARLEQVRAVNASAQRLAALVDQPAAFNTQLALERNRLGRYAVTHFDWAQWQAAQSGVPAGWSDATVQADLAAAPAEWTSKLQGVSDFLQRVTSSTWPALRAELVRSQQAQAQLAALAMPPGYTAAEQQALTEGAATAAAQISRLDALSAAAARLYALRAEPTAFQARLDTERELLRAAGHLPATGPADVLALMADFDVNAASLATGTPVPLGSTFDLGAYWADKGTTPAAGLADAPALAAHAAWSAAMAPTVTWLGTLRERLSAALPVIDDAIVRLESAWNQPANASRQADIEQALTTLRQERELHLTRRAQVDRLLAVRDDAVAFPAQLTQERAVLGDSDLFKALADFDLTPAQITGSGVYTQALAGLASLRFPDFTAARTALGTPPAEDPVLLTAASAWATATQNLRTALPALAGRVEAVRADLAASAQALQAQMDLPRTTAAERSDLQAAWHQAQARLQAFERLAAASIRLSGLRSQPAAFTAALAEERETFSPVALAGFDWASWQTAGLVGSTLYSDTATLAALSGAQTAWTADVQAQASWLESLITSTWPAMRQELTADRTLLQTLASATVGDAATLAALNQRIQGLDAQLAQIQAYDGTARRVREAIANPTRLAEVLQQERAAMLAADPQHDGDVLAALARLAVPASQFTVPANDRPVNSPQVLDLAAFWAAGSPGATTVSDTTLTAANATWASAIQPALSWLDQVRSRATAALSLIEDALARLADARRRPEAQVGDHAALQAEITAIEAYRADAQRVLDRIDTLLASRQDAAAFGVAFQAERDLVLARGGNSVMAEWAAWDIPLVKIAAPGGQTRLVAGVAVPTLSVEAAAARQIAPFQNDTSVLGANAAWSTTSAPARQWLDRLAGRVADTVADLRNGLSALQAQAAWPRATAANRAALEAAELTLRERLARFEQAALQINNLRSVASQPAALAARLGIEKAAAGVSDLFDSWADLDIDAAARAAYRQNVPVALGVFDLGKWSDAGRAGMPVQGDSLVLAPALADWTESQSVRPWLAQLQTRIAQAQSSFATDIALLEGARVVGTADTAAIDAALARLRQQATDFNQALQTVVALRATTTTPALEQAIAARKTALGLPANFDLLADLRRFDVSGAELQNAQHRPVATPLGDVLAYLGAFNISAVNLDVYRRDAPAAAHIFSLSAWQTNGQAGAAAVDDALVATADAQWRSFLGVAPLLQDLEARISAALATFEVQDANLRQAQAQGGAGDADITRALATLTTQRQAFSQARTVVQVLRAAPLTPQGFAQAAATQRTAVGLPAGADLVAWLARFNVTGADLASSAYQPSTQGLGDAFAYLSQFDVDNLALGDPAFRQTVSASVAMFDFGLWQTAHPDGTLQGGQPRTAASMNSALAAWDDRGGHRVWLSTLVQRIDGAVAQLRADRNRLNTAIRVDGNDDAAITARMATIDTALTRFDRARQTAVALQTVSGSAAQLQQAVNERSVALQLQGETSLASEDLFVWLARFDIAAADLSDASYRQGGAAIDTFDATAWRTALLAGNGYAPDFQDADVGSTDPASWGETVTALSTRQAAVAQDAADAQAVHGWASSALAQAAIAAAMGTPQSVLPDSLAVRELTLAAAAADRLTAARTETLRNPVVDAEAELRNRPLEVGDDGRYYHDAQAVLLRVARALNTLPETTESVTLGVAALRDPMFPNRLISLADLAALSREAAGFDLLALADPSVQRTSWTRAELQFIVQAVNAELGASQANPAVRASGAAASFIVSQAPLAQGQVAAQVNQAGYRELLRTQVLRSDLADTVIHEGLRDELATLMNGLSQLDSSDFVTLRAVSGGNSAIDNLVQDLATYGAVVAEPLRRTQVAESLQALADLIGAGPGTAIVREHLTSVQARATALRSFQVTQRDEALARRTAYLKAAGAFDPDPANTAANSQRLNRLAGLITGLEALIVSNNGASANFAVAVADLGDDPLADAVNVSREQLYAWARDRFGPGSAIVAAYDETALVSGANGQLVRSGNATQAQWQAALAELRVLKADLGLNTAVAATPSAATSLSAVKSALLAEAQASPEPWTVTSPAAIALADRLTELGGAQSPPLTLTQMQEWALAVIGPDSTLSQLGQGGSTQSQWLSAVAEVTEIAQSAQARSNLTPAWQAATSTVTAANLALTEINQGLAALTQLLQSANQSAVALQSAIAAIKADTTTYSSRGNLDLFTWLQRFDVPASTLWADPNDQISVSYGQWVAGSFTASSGSSMVSLRWSEDALGQSRSDRPSAATLAGRTWAQLTLEAALVAEAGAGFDRFEWARWKDGVDDGTSATRAVTSAGALLPDLQGASTALDTEAEVTAALASTDATVLHTQLGDLLQAQSVLLGVPDWLAIITSRRAGGPLSLVTALGLQGLVSTLEGAHERSLALMTHLDAVRAAADQRVTAYEYMAGAQMLSATQLPPYDSNELSFNFGGTTVATINQARLAFITDVVNDLLAEVPAEGSTRDLAQRSRDIAIFSDAQPWFSRDRSLIDGWMIRLLGTSSNWDSYTAGNNNSATRAQWLAAIADLQALQRDLQLGMAATAAGDNPARMATALTALAQAEAANDWAQNPTPSLTGVVAQAGGASPLNTDEVSAWAQAVFGPDSALPGALQRSAMLGWLTQVQERAQALTDFYTAREIEAGQRVAAYQAAAGAYRLDDDAAGTLSTNRLNTLEGVITALEDDLKGVLDWDADPDRKFDVWLDDYFSTHPSVVNKDDIRAWAAGLFGTNSRVAAALPSPPAETTQAVWLAALDELKSLRNELKLTLAATTRVGAQTESALLAALKTVQGHADLATYSTSTNWQSLFTDNASGLTPQGVAGWATTLLGAGSTLAVALSKAAPPAATVTQNEWLLGMRELNELIIAMEARADLAAARQQAQSARTSAAAALGEAQAGRAALDSLAAAAAVSGEALATRMAALNTAYQAGAAALATAIGGGVTVASYSTPVSDVSDWLRRFDVSQDRLTAGTNAQVAVSLRSYGGATPAATATVSNQPIDLTADALGASRTTALPGTLAGLSAYAVVQQGLIAAELQPTSAFDFFDNTDWTTWQADKPGAQAGYAAAAVVSAHDNAGTVRNDWVQTLREWRELSATLQARAQLSANYDQAWALSSASGAQGTTTLERAAAGERALQQLVTAARSSADALAAKVAELKADAQISAFRGSADLFTWLREFDVPANLLVAPSQASLTLSTQIYTDALDATGSPWSATRSVAYGSNLLGFSSASGPVGGVAGLTDHELARRALLTAEANGSLNPFDGADWQTWRTTLAGAAPGYTEAQVATLAAGGFTASSVTDTLSEIETLLDKLQQLANLRAGGGAESLLYATQQLAELGQPLSDVARRRELSQSLQFIIDRIDLNAASSLTVAQKNAQLQAVFESLGMQWRHPDVLSALTGGQMTLARVDELVAADWMLLRAAASELKLFADTLTAPGVLVVPDGVADITVRSLDEPDELATYAGVVADQAKRSQVEDALQALVQALEINAGLSAEEQNLRLRAMLQTLGEQIGQPDLLLDFTQGEFSIANLSGTSGLSVIQNYLSGVRTNAVGLVDFLTSRREEAQSRMDAYSKLVGAYDISPASMNDDLVGEALSGVYTRLKAKVEGDVAGNGFNLWAEIFVEGVYLPGQTFAYGSPTAPRYRDVPLGHDQLKAWCVAKYGNNSTFKQLVDAGGATFDATLARSAVEELKGVLFAGTYRAAATNANELRAASLLALRSAVPYTNAQLLANAQLVGVPGVVPIQVNVHDLVTQGNYGFTADQLRDWAIHQFGPSSALGSALNASGNISGNALVNAMDQLERLALDIRFTQKANAGYIEALEGARNYLLDFYLNNDWNYYPSASFYAQAATRTFYAGSWGAPLRPYPIHWNDLRDLGHALVGGTTDQFGNNTSKLKQMIDAGDSQQGRADWFAALRELDEVIAALKARAPMTTAVNTARSAMDEAQAALTEATVGLETLDDLVTAGAGGGAALSAAVAGAKLDNDVNNYRGNIDLLAWLRTFNVDPSLLWANSQTATLTWRENYYSRYQVFGSSSGTQSGNWTPDWTRAELATDGQAAYTNFFDTTTRDWIGVSRVRTRRESVLAAEAAGTYASFNWQDWKVGNGRTQNGSYVAAYQLAGTSYSDAATANFSLSDAQRTQVKTQLETLLGLVQQTRSYADLIEAAQQATGIDVMGLLQTLGIVVDGQYASRDGLNKLLEVVRSELSGRVSASTIAPLAGSNEPARTLTLAEFQATAATVGEREQALERIEAHLQAWERFDTLYERRVNWASWKSELDALLAEASSEVGALGLDTQALANALQADANVQAATAGTLGSYVPHTTFFTQVEARTAALLNHYESESRRLQIKRADFARLNTTEGNDRVALLDAEIARIQAYRVPIQQVNEVVNRFLAIVPATTTPEAITGARLEQLQQAVADFKKTIGTQDVMEYLHRYSIPVSAWQNNNNSTTKQIVSIPASGSVSALSLSYFDFAKWSATDNRFGAAATSLSLSDTTTDQYVCLSGALTAASQSDATLLAAGQVPSEATWSQVQSQVAAARTSARSTLLQAQAQLKLEVTDIGALLSSLRAVQVPGGYEGLWYQVSLALQGTQRTDFPSGGVADTTAMLEHPPGSGRRVSLRSLLDTVQDDAALNPQRVTLARRLLSVLDDDASFDGQARAASVSALISALEDFNPSGGPAHLRNALMALGYYEAGHDGDESRLRPDALHWTELYAAARRLYGEGSALVEALDLAGGGNGTVSATVWAGALADLRAIRDDMLLGADSAFLGEGQKAARVQEVLTALTTNGMGYGYMQADVAAAGYYLPGQIWNNTDGVRPRPLALHWSEFADWGYRLFGKDSALGAAMSTGDAIPASQWQAALTEMKAVQADLALGAEGLLLGNKQQRLTRILRDAAQGGDPLTVLTGGQFDLRDLSSSAGVTKASPLVNSGFAEALRGHLQGILLGDARRVAIANEVQAALSPASAADGLEAALTVKLGTAIQTLQASYQAHDWTTASTKNLATALGSLFTAQEIDLLKRDAKALRNDSATLEADMGTRNSEITSPTSTDSRLAAALADGASAVDYDWLAALSELHWLYQRRTRVAAAERVSLVDKPEGVEDLLAAVTQGAVSDADLSSEGLGVEADRNDLLVHLLQRMRAVYTTNSWPAEMKLGIFWADGQYGVDTGRQWSPNRAVAYAMGPGTVAALGRAFAGSSSALAYGTVKADGTDDFGYTAGRSLTKTEWKAAMDELEDILAQGFRQTQSAQTLSAALQAVATQTRLPEAPVQLTDVLGNELNLATFDWNKRETLLSAIRQALPGVDAALGAAEPPQPSSAGQRVAATVAARMRAQRAAYEMEMQRTFLSSATQVELRRDLTDGADIYVDRRGAYYINGTRTRAMDIAVTTRFLAHQNFANEYKVLMDDLAERNNLIAGARSWVDAVNNVTATVTTASPTMARAASALKTTLTNLGAPSWTSATPVILPIEKSAIKATLDTWATTTGSSDILFDLSNGRWSMKDWDTTNWYGGMGNALLGLMDDRIKIETLMAPIVALNGSVQSGDLLGEMSGGKYTSNVAISNRNRGAERMWTYLQYQANTAATLNQNTKNAFLQIMREEKERSGIDILSAATSGTYTIENWAAQGWDVNHRTALQNSLANYINRGAEKTIYGNTEMTDITNLLNTLISNKVRDNDLDQGKLQSITSQLQVNTEAMTALIKAFNELNSALAQALKR